MGNNVYDLIKDKEEDDDVMLALRGLYREMCLDDGMEIFTILNWLLWSMEKMKKMIDTQPIDEIDDYLARNDKEKEPKKDKIFSNISRDETSMWISHVAIPIGDVTRDTATPMDY